MGWEKKANGKQYFYLGRRVGGKVVKEYYGCGPAAVLAAQQLAARKQQRIANQEAVRAAKEQVASADNGVEQLTRSVRSVPPQIPATSCGCETPNSTGNSINSTNLLPKTASEDAEVSSTDPISCIQALLLRVQQGDPTAGIELETLLDQFPDLWLQMGDLGEQAVNAWLTLVSGKVPVLALAARKKLDALRAELLAAGTDIVTRLHADRVIATWMQVTYADVRYAQADKSSLPMLEFLAKRQKQYQQQYLAALGAWQRWRRAQQIGPIAKPAGVAAVASNRPAATASPTGSNLAEQNGWILPFPVAAVVDNTEQRIATGR